MERSEIPDGPRHVAPPLPHCATLHAGNGALPATATIALTRPWRAKNRIADRSLALFAATAGTIIFRPTLPVGTRDVSRRTHHVGRDSPGPGSQAQREERARGLLREDRQV